MLTSLVCGEYEHKAVINSLYLVSTWVQVMQEIGA